jgi:hypothetical protein
MLATDIDSGRVQLIFDEFNRTAERNIHTSHEASFMRLSQALKRHPPRYESNKFTVDNGTNTAFMKAVYNRLNTSDELS